MIQWGLKNLHTFDRNTISYFVQKNIYTEDNLISNFLTKIPIVVSPPFCLNCFQHIHCTNEYYDQTCKYSPVIKI